MLRREFISVWRLYAMLVLFKDVIVGHQSCLMQHSL